MVSRGEVSHTIRCGSPASMLCGWFCQVKGYFSEKLCLADALCLPLAATCQCFVLAYEAVRSKRMIKNTYTSCL